MEEIVVKLFTSFLRIINKGINSEYKVVVMEVCTKV